MHNNETTWTTSVLCNDILKNSKTQQFLGLMQGGEKQGLYFAPLVKVNKSGHVS